MRIPRITFSQPFSTTYKKLKPGIVAIVSKISQRPDFPDIIGTGFIAHEDGIVITNNHVIEAIKKLPRRKGSPDDEWPIRVMYLHDMPGKGVGKIFFDVEAIATLGREKPVEGYHYGPDIPDIGFIYTKVKGLPKLELEKTFELEEGDEIYTAGYPLGTNTLRAPGWIHQINPVLQRGIVSAIQPFQCDKPHGLLINVMSQGGASGSPIFNPKTGKVTALLYGGIIDWKGILIQTDGNSMQLPHQNGTALTLAIPAYIVSEIFEMSLKELTDRKTGTGVIRDVSNHPTLDHLLNTLPVITNTPKGPMGGTEAVPATEIEFPKV